MPFLNDCEDSTLTHLFSFVFPIPNFCRFSCVCSKWKRLVAAAWPEVRHLWIEGISGKTSRRSPIMRALDKSPNINRLTVYNVSIAHWSKLLEKASQLKKLVIVGPLLVDKTFLRTIDRSASDQLEEIQLFGCYIRRLSNDDIVNTLQFTFCPAEHSYRKHTLYRHPSHEHDSDQVAQGVEHARAHGLRLDTALVHGESNIISVIAASKHIDVLQHELSRLSSPPHVNILYHIIDAASKSLSNIDINVKAINLVLEYSVDMNRSFDTSQKDYMICQDIAKGTTPLLFAAQKGNLDIFKTLYNRMEANKQCTDAEGNTLLHVAAKSFSETIVEYLISNDSSLVNTLNNDHKTPLLSYLCAAIQSSQFSEKIFDLMTDKTKLRSSDKDGNTAMHLAAKNSENIELMSKILQTDSKQDLLKENNYGETPFAILATNSHSTESKNSIIEMMVNAKPEIITKRINNPKDSTETTLTHLLCDNANSLSVLSDVILAKDKNALTLRDGQGRTPLHIAAGTRTQEVVKFLLDSGADPSEVVDNEDNTPLHLACKGLNNIKQEEQEEEEEDSESIYQVVKMLLESGGENLVNKVNKEKKNALHLAVEHIQFSEQLCKLFIEHDVDCNAVDQSQNTPLISYILNNGTNPEITTMLITKENINKPNGTGLYPLVAAFNENPKSSAFIKVLIESGADVNVVDEEDQDRPSVLILATESKSNIKIIKLLLEKGANPNASCASSNTAPLHIACENGLEKVCDALLKHGADPFFADGTDTLPLIYAVAQGYPKIAEKLMDDHMGGSDALLTKMSPLQLDALLLEFIRQNFNLELVQEVFAKRIKELQEMDEEKRPEFLLFEDETSDCVSLIHVVCREGLLEMLETYLQWVSLHNPPKHPKAEDDVKEKVTPMEIDGNGEKEESNEVDKEDEKENECKEDNDEKPLRRGRGRPPKNSAKPRKKTKKQNKTEAKKKKRFFPRWNQLRIKSNEGLQRAIVNVRDTKGNTPLHYCAQAHDANHRCDEINKQTIVDTLVNVGADINARNADGDTPLHIASRRGAQAVAMVMVSTHGASQYVVNDYGRTPEDEAMQTGFYSFFSSFGHETASGYNKQDIAEPRRTRSSASKREKSKEGEGSPASKRRRKSKN